MQRRISRSIAWLAAAAAAAAAADPAAWVAQPGRSLDAEWPPTPFAGRDCWVLNWEKLFDAEGVKDEPFVKEGGIQCLRFEKVGALERRNVAERAALAIRDLACFDDAGSALPPGAWTVEPSSPRPEVRFFYPEALSDDTPSTAFVAVGDEARLPADETLRIVLRVTPSGDRPIGRLVFTHGLQGNGCLGHVTVRTRAGEGWVPAPCSTQAAPDRIELTLARPAAGPLELVCDNQPSRFVIRRDRFPLQALLPERPFFIYMFHKRYLPGIRPEQMDADSLAELDAAYPKTHIGFMLSEWDSTMRALLDAARRNPESAAARVLPPYTNRAEAYASVKHYFDYQKSLFHGGRIFAHSGGFTFPQYAAEWGAHALEMQLTGMTPNLPDRSCLMFIRGAARRYGLPWSAYVAVFYANAHPTFLKPGHGKPASLLFREWLTGYYFGATFFSVEGQAIGSLTLQDGESGRLRLSPHGEAVRDCYAWMRSPAGVRGTCYTPILFLVDLHHGRGGRRGWAGPYDWKVWTDLEMEDGDYMLEHLVRTVDRFVDSGHTEEYDFRPPYSQNLRNSRLGDLYDVFFANPPSQGGVIRKDQLDPYAVAVLAGDIRMSEPLADRLRAYVREGGTLVVNNAQCAAPLADPAFLGVAVGTNAVWENDLWLAPLELRGADTLLASESGAPLVTRHRVGQGHVLVTAPRFLVMKDRQTPAPFIETLLLTLQDEVLPIRVRGNCQFLLNRIAPDRWQAVLINNEGVIKHPTDPDTFFLKSYDAPVTLDAPAGLAAREVFQGAPLERAEEQGRARISVVVPAGQARIVEFTGPITMDGARRAGPGSRGMKEP